MPFALSNGTLSVTGTENMFDCTVGLDRNYGGRKVFRFTRLVVEQGAELTIDPRTATVFLSGGSQANGALRIRGVLNLGADVQNFDASFTYQTEGDAVIHTGNTGNGYSTFAVQVSSSGVLNWKGATIRAQGTLNVVGQMSAKNAVFVGRGDRQIRIRATASASIDGLTSYHSPVLIYNNPVPFRGLRSVNADTAQSNRNAYGVLAYGTAEGYSTFAGTILFEDLQVEGARNEVGIVDNPDVELRNSAAGSDLSVVAWLISEGAAARRQGYARTTKRVDLSAATPAGVAVEGAKFYARDYDGGHRRNRNGRDDTAMKIYAASSAADGTADFTITTAIWNLDAESGGVLTNVDRRSKFNDVRDIFDICCWSYGHLPARLSLELRGKGAIPANFTLLADATITEADEDIVAAYTEIDTPQKFYDACKKYIADNYACQNEMPVTRINDTIYSDDSVIIFNNAAIDPISIAHDGTITIKAEMFRGNFVISGDSRVILQGGASVDGTIIDADGDSALVFSGVDSWTLFPTAADRDANTNMTTDSAAQANANIYRFNFAAATTFYFRIRIGAVQLFYDAAITAAGRTAADITTAGQIAALSGKTDALIARPSPLTADETTSALEAAEGIGGGASAADIRADLYANPPPQTFYEHQPLLSTDDIRLGCEGALNQTPARDLSNFGIAARDAILAAVPDAAWFANAGIPDAAPTANEIAAAVAAPSAADNAAAVAAATPPIEFFTSLITPIGGGATYSIGSIGAGLANFESAVNALPNNVRDAILAATPAADFFANSPNAPTPADISNAVWQRAIDGQINAARALTIISAVLFGRARISNNGAQVEFLNTAGEVVIRATVAETGARTEIQLPD